MKSLNPNNLSLASGTAEQAQALRPLRNLVGGSWQDPAVPLDATICNSNTAEVLAEQRGSSSEQIEAAITAASGAHRSGAWNDQPAEKRAETLRAIATGLDERAADIALVDALTTGVPITQTRILSRVCGAAFRNAAELLLEDPVLRRDTTFLHERLPLGPAAIIAPWNAPAGIACHKLASALAAGCPVVFKPSEWAPHSAQIIAAVIDDLDLPDGIFNLLHGAGATGAQIVGDDRIAAVSLTGGLESGRAVATACAAQLKPAQLELGGNNPLIVLPDAAVDAAADGVVTALTTLNGQWCRALGRLLVHESIAADLYDAVMERLSRLTVGASTDDSADMGPMVHAGHLQHVESAIEEFAQRGGMIHASSTLPDLAGWFVAPTLISGVAPVNALHEVFGPVATVHEFADVEDAVAIANQAPFGLSAYLFGGRNEALAIARRIETGMIKINSVTLFSPHPDLPRAAWKQSGLGEEGSRETFEFFRGTRVIGFPEGETEC